MAIRPGWLWVTLLLACAEPKAPPDPIVDIVDVGVGLPVPSGWVVDETVRVSDPAKGGTVLRLVRKNIVLGSPRITVEIEPLHAQSTLLEELLTRCLQEVGELERRKEIRNVTVRQKDFLVGPRRAYLVTHDYLLGQGAGELAVTQMTGLLVLDGRGLVVTAYGRTELFRPLQKSITEVLTGLTTPTMTRGNSNRSGSVFESRGTSTGPLDVEPIDLGKIGEKK